MGISLFSYSTTASDHFTISPAPFCPRLPACHQEQRAHHPDGACITPANRIRRNIQSEPATAKAFKGGLCAVLSPRAKRKAQAATGKSGFSPANGMGFTFSQSRRLQKIRGPFHLRPGTALPFVDNAASQLETFLNRLLFGVTENRSAIHHDMAGLNFLEAAVRRDDVKPHQPLTGLADYFLACRPDDTPFVQHFFHGLPSARW